MRVYVTAKPNARETRVVGTDATHYEISVTEPPTEGRANQAVADALADHLGVPVSRIALKGGARSRKKVFEVR